MLMLSRAANGQQDSKKIDELIFHYPICSAHAETADLGAQPCRLAHRFQRWGKAAILRLKDEWSSREVLQHSPCSPRSALLGFG